MKHFKTLVSFLLLIVFGLVLGSQAFGHIGHENSCDSFTTRDDIRVSIEAGLEHQDCGSSQADSHAHSQKCTDPCHMGHSHFGHCSYIATSSDLRLHSVNSKILSSDSRQTTFESPNLDGLRRPPRIA